MQLVMLTSSHTESCLHLQEVAESVKQDFGTIDILVHSLANGPEVFIASCFAFLFPQFHDMMALNSPYFLFFAGYVG